ncbi:hypothetical protein KBD81_02680, partial [Candidatus Woesebacteria bacterium]|nr:hypothetical protein [Candidatus Woesebacteria bacterium]
MNPEATTTTTPTIPEKLSRSSQPEQSVNADYLELGVSDAEAILKTYKSENPGIAENLIQAQARGEYTPVITKKIRRKKAESQEVREAMEVEQVVQDLNHSSQNILRVVSEFLHAAELGIIAKPQDVQTRAVFESMVDKTEGRLTKKTAAFLVPLIDGMMNENSYVRFAPAGQAPTQFETDMMSMLSGNDDETAYLLNEILLAPISQGKLQNMDTSRFQTFFTELRTKKRIATDAKKKEIIDAAKKAQTKNNSSFASQEYERIFSEDDPEKKRAFELYEAIKSSNVDDFVAYYERSTSRVIESKNCSREEAGKLVTGDIHDTLLYIVNTIYATTLAKAPKAEFKQVAGEQGAGSYVNPNNIFNEVVAGNLSRLLESAQKRIDQQEQPWYVHGRRKTENYNPDRQKIEETTVPIAKLERTNLTKYVQSLREIVEIEQGALEYQFNLRYIIEHPPAADKGGVFGSIAGYAKQSLKTETIDHLYILPHNEVIQAAVMSLEPMYKRLFAKYDWRKDQALQAELFEQMRPAEKKAIEQLQSYFKGTIPAWTVERAFNHARLLSFGKEFAFQALASYADPLLTDEGDPTYLGEGPLDGNSVYDLFVAAKRWGSADPIIVGLPYMPENAMIDEFHPKELKEEGEERWKDSFTNGTLAYYESKVFKDSHPMISITNMTKMGGVDTYGGWRVKYAYSHWLNEIIDKKSNSMDMKHPDNNLLVNGWKSIENIGTNVLKNYAESFIFDAKFDKNFENYEGKFEQFFKFLHKRYFKEGMGKSLYQDVANETAFWNKVKSEISKSGQGSAAAKQEIVKRYVYDALTVALFERMPLEFVFMERRRASQNGVTMQQELLEEFVGSPGRDTKGKWAQDAE